MGYCQFHCTAPHYIDVLFGVDEALGIRTEVARW